MDFTLDKSQKEIQRAAWEFARGLFDKEKIIDWSKTQEFPKAILKKAGELGFIGIHFPESVDGGGMGLLEYALVAETLCRRDSSLGSALLFAAYGSECLLRFGSEEMKTRFLPPLVEGETICTGAFMEADQGYDLRKMNTTAVKENSEWIISGEKGFVPFGESANFFVVLCTTNPKADPPASGMSLFLVESDRPGVSAVDAGEKLGGRLIPFSNVSFDCVRVPAQNLIGSESAGYDQVKRFLAENRIQIAAMALGTAQGAYDRALDYVKQREQFGKKLAQFQITRHKIADMAARIETARLLTYHAAWKFDHHQIDDQSASMAKLVAAQTAMAVTDEAIQLMGGYGYMTEYEVEHFYRDAKQAEIFQGTPAVQKDIISDEIFAKLK